MTPRHSGGSDSSSSAKPKLDSDNFVAPATPSQSTPGSVRKQDKGRSDDKRQQKKKHFYQKTKVFKLNNKLKSFNARAG